MNGRRIPGLGTIGEKPWGGCRLLGAAFVLILLPQMLLARDLFRGRILEGEQPLIDVKVVLLELKLTARSDRQGYFTMKQVPPGFYTFRIYFRNRLIQQRREVRGGETVTVFYITPQAGSSETVTRGGIEIIGIKDRTKLSRHRLDRTEIKRLPGVYGDSLKAIGTMPGVFPVQPVGPFPGLSIARTAGVFGGGPPYSNSINGFLVLRGGGALSNSFYLDGFKMLYPYHLGDQSSVLNNDFIRSIDIYTGTFPVRYGNATGGVIAVTGPEHVEKSEGHLNISLFQSDIFYQQPIFEQHGYVVAAARKNYPNHTMLRLYPDAVPANAKYADYYDGQFKMGLRFTPEHELIFLHFGARDIYAYTREVDKATNDRYGGAGGAGGGLAAVADRPPIGLDRGFQTQGLKYSFCHGSRLQNDLYIQLSRFNEEFELEVEDPFTAETIFGFDVVNSRHEFQVRDEFNLEIVPGHALLKLGAERNDYRWELSMSDIRESQTWNENTGGLLDTIDDLIENNRTFRALWDGDRTEFQLNAAFVELELEVGRWRFTPGVRGEYFSLSADTGVGPRLGVEFAIPETGTTLLLGVGRHFGLPPTLDQISIESGNPRLKMEQSDHMAAGVEQKLRGDWLIKAEIFRNIFRSLVVTDGYITEPFGLRTNKRDLVQKTQDVIENPYENDPLNFSNDGSGQSYGVELFIKRSRPHGSNGWFGWLSYTWSITKRNNHQPRMSDDELDDLRARNLNRTLLYQYHFDRNMVDYYDNGDLEIIYDNDREELYDLDRTHQISLVLNYKFNARWQLGARWRYAENVPRTPITGDEQPQLPVISNPVFLPVYSDYYNSERLGPFHQLDVRLDYFINYSWGYANCYIELVNLYARKNPEQENFDNFYPYVRGSNPSISYESTYYESKTGEGRSVLWPMINIGMEIKF